MAFELKKTKNLDRRLRKIAESRVEKAAQILELFPKTAAARDNAIHETRKYLKQARALLELACDALGKKNHADMDETLRTAAHPLGPARDGKATVEVLAKLARGYPKSLTPAVVDPIRRFLEKAAAQERRDLSLKKPAATLKKFAKSIGKHELPHDEKQLVSALHRAFGDTRMALTAAKKNPTDTTLHELRKRTKTLRYQLELLRPLLAKPARKLIDPAHRLTDLLGEDHDLAVLAALLAKEIQEKLPFPEAAPVVEAITHRRLHLQKSALALAEKILTAPRLKTLTLS